MKTIVIIICAALSLINCKNKTTHEEHGTKTQDVYYTCSMDPQVMETKPGQCPICKMDLTPISRAQLQSTGIKLSDEQVKLANIKTQKISYGYLEQQIFATGTVIENENNVHFINAKVEGRIEKLYVKTKGSSIQKGQVLYEIYSEMLASTQSEFITNRKLLRERPMDDLLKTIQQNTYNKLLLWGMTESQIKQLNNIDQPIIPFPIQSPASGIVRAVRISEGNTVMEGQPLVELTAYNSLWIDAQFYPNETGKINTGNTVAIYIEGGSSEPVEGKVLQILPQVSPSSTIHIVRILFTPNDALVRPGMQAGIAWHKEGKKSLIVPSQAVLREAKGNTVWIKNKKGIYEPKMIHLGEVSGTRAEVLHGLEEGDEVVISGAYLLQSDYIFKKGNDPMKGHDMSNM